MTHFYALYVVFVACFQVYTERGAYDEAEEMFDKSLELSPDNANIWVHKGYAIT